MPAVPTSYTNPTGKQNAITSFKNWLVTNVPTAGVSDFTYAFLADVSNPQVFPLVTVTELPYFDPGISSFGMNLFPASSYPVSSPATQGTLSKLLMQIEIKTDQGADNSALKKAYKLRDRFKRGLTLAGVSADDIATTTLVPPILVLDYDTAGNPETGIVLRPCTESDSGIQEIYIPPDEATPNIHTLRLLALLEWYELN